MKTKITLFFSLISFVALAQTARVKGIILDENNQPVENVNVTFQDRTTQSNANGFYILTIPSNVKSNLKFSHLSLKAAVITLELKANEDYEFNIVLKKYCRTIG